MLILRCRVRVHRLEEFFAAYAASHARARFEAHSDAVRPMHESTRLHDDLFTRFQVPEKHLRVLSDDLPVLPRRERRVGVRDEASDHHRSEYSRRRRRPARRGRALTHPQLVGCLRPRGCSPDGDGLRDCAGGSGVFRLRGSRFHLDGGDSCHPTALEMSRKEISLSQSAALIRYASLPRASLPPE
eukprot:CAMPEP_0173391394 /NCGR_PEP_ID=MMETSP1356-20130122/18359_1 /TAXON_ID=77927 ORGANISM="Hemiselmis virescens, Strain PCC157" /NCGR_SAMPLE_ID=MMETSP1356 /ASSEMBLY_ACC=CAM_ASM_000847 /LENGTH=185 /DNA_ID=CAMNT_0014349019 /DNA_START=461 /DNA_END=1018 /DNA_ORIENTATION=+